MNKVEQKNAFDKIMDQCAEILLRKGDDYALDTDRLSNFKLSGQIIGVEPEMQVLSLIATKVARLGTLMNNYCVSNEPIEDTVFDLINYSILLKMVMDEPKVRPGLDERTNILGTIYDNTKQDGYNYGNAVDMGAASQISDYERQKKSAAIEQELFNKKVKDYYEKQGSDLSGVLRRETMDEEMKRSHIKFRDHENNAGYGTE